MPPSPENLELRRSPEYLQSTPEGAAEFTVPISQHDQMEAYANDPANAILLQQETPKEVWTEAPAGVVNTAEQKIPYASTEAANTEVANAAGAVVQTRNVVQGLLNA